MADRAHRQAERHEEADQQAEKQAAFNFSGVTAGALASVAAAFFTSRLGVAGTLIGAALTSIVITMGSAIVRSSLERASGTLSKANNRIPRPPDRVVRPDGEDPAAQDEGMSRRSRRERRGSPFGRLSASLNDFGRLPAGVRRRVLTTGLAASVVAFAIGLLAITGIETAIGEPLSSVGRSPSYSEGSEAASGGAGTQESGTTLSRVFGASGGANATDSQYASPSDDAPAATPDSQGIPGSQGTPSDSQQAPAASDPSGGATPDAGGSDGSPPVQDGATPTPQEQPAQPDPSQPAAPAQPAPETPSQEVPSGTPSGALSGGQPAAQPAPGS